MRICSTRGGSLVFLGLLLSFDPISVIVERPKSEISAVCRGIRRERPALRVGSRCAGTTPCVVTRTPTIVQHHHPPTVVAQWPYTLINSLFIGDFPYTVVKLINSQDSFVIGGANRSRFNPINRSDLNRNRNRQYRDDVFSAGKTSAKTSVKRRSDLRDVR